MINKNLLRGHSPAPWDSEYQFIVGPDGETIICDMGSWDKEPQDSNARLIAAAPILLAEHDVLCELVGLYETRSALTINSNAWNEMTYKITTLRGRLQIE